MKKFFALLIRNFLKDPLKMTLTIFAVALGTGIVILSFSAGSILKNEILGSMNENGLIIHAANGSISESGDIQLDREWDTQILERLISDSATISEVSMVTTFPIPEVTTEGSAYKIRNLIGTDPNYFKVFNLEIVSGNIMTQEDFDSGFKRIWINEETAITLYGSAEDALGKQIAPPGMNFGRGARREQALITQFSVSGVFANSSEEIRRSYGIGDFLVPITAIMPTDRNTVDMLNSFAGKIVVKSSSVNIERVESEISQIARSLYGETSSVLVWEGTSDGPSTYLQELRNTISIFSISINILGIVLLLTSSLGIFSIMVVEALARRKEIALERSMGASQSMIIKEFWGWSIMLTLIGATIGTIIAILIAKPLLSNLSPLLGELSVKFTESSSIRFSSIISGFLISVGCGGILGILPAVSAVKGNIAETLRES